MQYMHICWVILITIESIAIFWLENKMHGKPLAAMETTRTHNSILLFAIISMMVNTVFANCWCSATAAQHSPTSNSNTNQPWLETLYRIFRFTRIQVSSYILSLSFFHRVSIRQVADGDSISMHLISSFTTDEITNSKQFIHVWRERERVGWQKNHSTLILHVCV